MLAVPRPPPADLGRGVRRRRCAKDCASRRPAGVTAVHDKDGWIGALRFWQALDDLTLRVWQSFPAEHLDRLAELGLRSGFGSPMLRVGYLKAFMDGTLGSQTARMLDGSGVEITSGEEFAEIVRRGAEAGWPVAVHAIGDLANREALDAFEETREAWAPLGLRQRIEHAQLLAPEDVARFAELGVAASVQFSHAPSDRDVADRFWAGKTGRRVRLPLALGLGRPRRQRLGRADRGARSARQGSSPASCERSTNGPRGIRSRRSVSRRRSPRPASPRPGSPYDEHRRGKLVPGYFADLVVLDRDPVAIPPEELPEVHVVATMVGGRWTHNPPPWD